MSTQIDSRTHLGWPALPAVSPLLLACLFLVFTANASAATVGNDVPAATDAVSPSSVTPGGVRQHIDPSAPQFVIRDGVLTEDANWRGEVLIEGAVTVASQTTLTISPGTIIRFTGNEIDTGARGVLLVFGRLVARGRAGQSILFTAADAAVTAGRWQGLVFLGSDKKNLLEHCRVEGATTAIDAAFATLALKEVQLSASTTGLRCQDCLLTMTGGGAEHCGLGMTLSDSETDLRELTMRNNGRGFDVVRSSLSLTGSSIEENERGGVVVDGGRLALSANRVVNNGSGLTLTACEGNITSNRVADNRGHGVHLAKARLRVEGNSIEHNGGNGLEVEDGTAIAWGNALTANGGYDCFNAGTEDFRAIGNWWGGKDGTDLATRIYDHQGDGHRGRVIHQPILRQRPSRAP